ncbi:hypothetical protein DBR06_SOUSAS10210002, partial [Sousa chinensis]
NTFHHNPYPHRHSIMGRSPATIRGFTQTNNYPRGNKNDNIILP